MIGRQPATAFDRTTCPPARRNLLATATAIAATVVLTTFGGGQSAQAATLSPTGSAPMVKPAADASQPGSAYQYLTATDIKAVTGQDVQPMSSQQVICLIGNCGAYADAAGQPYMLVNVLTTQPEIEAARQAVSPLIFKVHEQPSGIGDRADFFKDNAEAPLLRCLIVQQGDTAVELAPFMAASTVTDEQLVALAMTALGPR